MPNLQISRDDLIVSDRSRLFVVARSRPNLPPMAQQMERLWRQVNTGPPPKPLGRWYLPSRATCPRKFKPDIRPAGCLRV
jgi:hypothetical protein